MCSIFRSLFWVQTIATKVKYGFFHLRDGVDSQNVSDFGSFGIWVFRGRDAQPVETCFLQWVLRMPRSCSHSLGLPHRQFGGHHLTTCLQMTVGVSHFSFPWETVQGRTHWVFSASCSLFHGFPRFHSSLRPLEGIGVAFLVEAKFLN